MARFRRITNVNSPNAKLVGFPVSVEDGHLIAELPDD